MSIKKQKQFAAALFAGTHSPAAVLEEFCSAPETDQPIDLTGITDFARYLGYKVKPTPGVAAYLATEDALTDAAIDNMEIAIENAHGIRKPFFITSERKGTAEAKNLKLDYFYLAHDPGHKTEG